MNRAEFFDRFQRASDKPMNEERKLAIIRNSYAKMSDGNDINGSLNMVVVMEELAELQQEISKMLRNKGSKIGLIEELADVLLAIPYVQDIFNISDDDLVKAMNAKLERQNERNPVRV